MQVTPHGLALNKDDNSNDQIRGINNETPSKMRAFRYLKLENDYSIEKIIFSVCSFNSSRFVLL